MKHLQKKADLLRKQGLGLIGLGGLGTAAEASILVATGASIHGDQSGLPDTEGFLAMDASGLNYAAFGDGVKLWGSSGQATKVDFYSHDNWSGQPVYFEGMSLNWSGTVEGIFVGDQWEYDEVLGEDVLFPGDHLALDYEFTVNQSGGIQFDYLFMLHIGEESNPAAAWWTGNGATVLNPVDGGSGMVEAPAQTSAEVSGSVRFDPFSWSNEPETFDHYWKLSLVVRPWNVGDWEPGDNLEVIVPGNSIDVGINTVPVPEPATVGLGIGLMAFAAVAVHKLRNANRPH
jgi:hypothetical protein